MWELFWADLKMIFRNRQSLVWGLVFPLIFTVVFGAFFGKGSESSGTVALINDADTPVSEIIQKALEESEMLKLQTDLNVDEARNLLKKNQITAIILIPENFGAMQPEAPTKVSVVYDPANVQTNGVVLSFVDKLLTQISLEVQHTQVLFSIEEEKTNTNELTYFDFVLVGLIGMSMMNSAVQGVGINLANYREDKILKRLVTTPLKTWRFVLAEVGSRLVLNIIQISIILGVGIWVFGAHIIGSIWMVYLFALLGAMLFQSFGFVVAAFSKTTDAAQGMATAVTIPMMFLTGVFFPIDQLPRWLYAVVEYLPLAPLLRMIRTIALEGGSPFTDPRNMIIVCSWIIVALVLAAYKFKLSDE